jgi:16S rRNA (cytosine1402-N4)-methyltransferase
MHFSVMARESLDLLAIRPDGVYLDATCGLGGHTGLIAERLTAGGLVIACDRDAESLEMARANTAQWSSRIWFRQATFADLADTIAEARLEKIDGLLADLGVSRYQLTSPERGFSFLTDSPADMRMDRSVGRTAAEIVNTTAEEALADLIFQLGGERRARKLARALVRARPIRSTRHLADVVERAVPRARNTKLHPATQTFMALRMAVNDELGQLDRLLEAGPGLIAPGGRMVVISFTSTEDRKVKERFKTLGSEGRAAILTRKPLEPSPEETSQNAASRSARLRAVEMK